MEVYWCKNFYHKLLEIFRCQFLTKFTEVYRYKNIVRKLLEFTVRNDFQKYWSLPLEMFFQKLVEFLLLKILFGNYWSLSLENLARKLLICIKKFTITNYSLRSFVKHGMLEFFDFNRTFCNFLVCCKLFT